VCGKINTTNEEIGRIQGDTLCVCDLFIVLKFFWGWPLSFLVPDAKKPSLATGRVRYFDKESQAGRVL
jgi:hypothetical protein